MKILVATTDSDPRYSYEIVKTVPYDDLSIDDLVEVFKELALAMGYRPENVKESFGDSEGS